MSNDSILALARERYKAALDGDFDNRQRDMEDRRFYKGGKHQWDAAALRQRQGRPSLTINRLPQFVKQVTGEMRQNRPAIRVLPVDEQSDPQLAETYAAIIRHIESRSDAQRVYAKSGEQAVIGGIGWFRVLTDYLDDTSFDQEIVVKHIRNPLSVVVDPAAIGALREDMNFAFVSEMMQLADFKANYPKASVEGFPDDDLYHEWRRGEEIRVAEYWWREDERAELLLLSDGSTRESGDEAALLQAIGLTIVARRPITRKKVRWVKMSGVEVLEEGEWAGRYIPLVPVIGEEVEVGDEIFRHGMIHHSIDSQRSYNFARSAMNEHVASQPKSPYLATATMVANHLEQWQSLNVSNPPVLLYDPDPQAPGLKPAREQPPTFAAAWYQEAQIADQDMKATTGIYDASLGKAGNETSGRAILARDQQGETANYVYVDNLNAAIRHAGKILLDLIPQIYTGERVIRILGEDRSIEGYARINTMLPDGTVMNDLSVGQFDIEVTTGPSFATKRMEAADKLMQLVQSVPQIGQFGADMIIKSLDIPHGDKLADRLAFAMLPPGLDAEVDQRRQEAAAGQQQQQQPDPMQMVALEKAKAETEKTQSEAARNMADAQLKGIQAQSQQAQFAAMVEQAVAAHMERLGYALG